MMVHTFICLGHDVNRIVLLLENSRVSIAARNALFNTIHQQVPSLTAEVYCEGVYLVQLILRERSNSHGETARKTLANVGPRNAVCMHNLFSQEVSQEYYKA